jgi:hypothetical protein
MHASRDDIFDELRTRAVRERAEHDVRAIAQDLRVDRLEHRPAEGIHAHEVRMNVDERSPGALASPDELDDDRRVMGEDAKELASHEAGSAQHGDTLRFQDA